MLDCYCLSSFTTGIFCNWEPIIDVFGDQVFLNIVLDEAVEEKAGGEKVRIGMVVGLSRLKKISVLVQALICVICARSSGAIRW